MNSLLNFVGFQIVWVLAVGGAAKGLWWPGLAGLLVYAGLQLYFSRWAAADFALLLLAALIGCAADSLLVHFELVRYATPVPSGAYAPVWIAGLWMAFSLTINHSMSWLKGRWVMAVLFGAIGGPLVFWIAARYWHAVEIVEPQWRGLIALGVEWALMTPLLLMLSAALLKRFPGRAA
jgi:hypothetical protein